MRVLISCEESQEVCKAFRALGHEAFSCDIQDCSGGHPEWHIKGDAIEAIINNKWDLVIAHPPCTYLCNSGVRWLKGNPVRFEQMLEAVQFFVNIKAHCEKLNIPYCIENPIPHKYAVNDFSGYRGIGKYSQIIHPWQFGHGEMKATCLWLYKLPSLRPTNIVEGREQRIWKLPPSNGRAKERSKTFTGIAKAMADQWGSLNSFSYGAYSQYDLFNKSHSNLYLNQSPTNRPD